MGHILIGRKPKSPYLSQRNTLILYDEVRGKRDPFRAQGQRAWVSVRVEGGSGDAPDGPGLRPGGVRSSGGYDASDTGAGQAMADWISVRDHSQTSSPSENYVLISEMTAPIC